MNSGSGRRFSNRGGLSRRGGSGVRNNTLGCRTGQERRDRPIGYHLLIELSEQEDTDELLLRLASMKDAFQNLVNSSSTNEDWSYALLKIFHKISEADKTERKNIMLTLLRGSPFFERCLKKSLIIWSASLPMEEKQYVVSAMTSIIGTFFKTFPSSWSDMPLAELNEFARSDARLDPAAKRKIQSLLEERTRLVKRSETRTTSRRSQFNFTNEPPPDDFRESPTVPTTNDIHRQTKPYLRPIKSQGSYDDGEHYLDVQFRLLREDLVAPLREGVHEIIQEIPKRDRKHGLKVYSKVQVLYPHCSKSGLIHRIIFDTADTQGFPWKHSRRLIYGSLLCISKDGFQTMIFATVADRNPKDLEKGELDVRFVDVLEVNEYFQNGEIMEMVESSTYFEAYKHVLDGMKDFDAENLPMHKYIVDCESHVEAPKYVRQWTSYDFSKTLELKPHQSNIHLLNERSWPRYDDTTLNESQFNAFKHALTKEFVVIQGPPGTGKTHVGIRITDALLVNKHHWNVDGRTPMLVVCYTNHALDQFLSGIITFGHKNVIRVGSRANQEMQNYSLFNALMKSKTNARTAGRNNSDEFRLTRRAKAKCLAERDDCIREHERYSQAFQTTQKKLHDGQLVHFSVLRQFMSDLHAIWLEPYDTKCCDMKMSVFDVFLQIIPISEDQIFGLILQEEEPIRADANAVSQETPPAGQETDGVDIDGEGEVLVERWAADTNEFKAISFKNVVQDEVTFNGNKPLLIDSDGFQLVQPRRWEKKNKIQKALKEHEPAMTETEAAQVNNPWELGIANRWRLYKFWLRKQADICRQQCAYVEERLESVCREFQELQYQEDEIALRKADVIAMTTTCAARYRRSLQKIAPKVVVIEEAAEVLEAHVITALSKGLEHLILIGDHQQLKPNPSVFELAQQYFLEVSLFQRMVENGMECHTLDIQHRMRPEISRYLCHIYPNLKDHQSVKSYPNVKGIGKNVMFIHHEEKEYEVKHMRSKANQHEAEFMKSLCLYLLQQGYEPTQITIITGYTGQLIQLKRLMPRDIFQGVRVTAVDNFQGEENDIILLSLVRSNESGNIGFLKTDNRICVALSRAKHGLFVIGNFKIMAKCSNMWRKIVKDVSNNGCLAWHLPMACQNHPEVKFHARCATDFKRAPEGGCTKPCEFRLNCGHVCERVCHPVDPMHLKYKCQKTCLKVICRDNHRCRKTCHLETLCGPCKVPVEKKLPTCGHTQLMACHQNPSEFICQHVCEKLLPCKHRCKQRCNEPCRKEICKEPVQKILVCDHVNLAECSLNITSVICRSPCNALLDCEHRCSGTCGGCKQSRLHEKCKEKCGRVLVCSHQCLEPCTKNCPPCKRICQNRCFHSSCHKKCGEICTPCKEQCTWKCHHQTCTNLCGEICNREPCNMSCPKLLNCGHPCIGLCGEICPGQCRICNKDEVEEMFFGSEDEKGARFIILEDCKHIFEVEAMDRWMQQENTGGDVKMKECPRCKTIIRKSVRYGNIVKRTLKDINDIKEKIIQDGSLDMERITEEAYVICRKINDIIRNLSFYDKIFFQDLRVSNELEKYTTSSKFRAGIERSGQYRRFTNNPTILIERLLMDSIGFVAVNSILHQAKLLEALWNLKKEILKNPCFLHGEKERLLKSKDITQLEAFIMKERLNEQQLRDASDDLERARVFVSITACKNQLQSGNSLAYKVVSREVKKIQDEFISGKKIDMRRLSEYTKRLKQIKLKFSLDGLSEKERVEIVRAVGLGKGHWYKCPNGHFYAIGECGGATETSRCPDCGAKIGGISHELVAGNRHAGEMDGSSFAAYSEEANNMFNFDPEQLRNLRL